jgi:hypothetical protein
MLAFVDLEERVPPHHPLRSIKRFADRALATLSPTFDAMYGAAGRPSIPPERLLKASLLISLYSVRSERAFCEELHEPFFINLLELDRAARVPSLRWRASSALTKTATFAAALVSGVDRQQAF